MADTSKRRPKSQAKPPSRYARIDIRVSAEEKAAAQAKAAAEGTRPSTIARAALLNWLHGFTPGPASARPAETDTEAVSKVEQLRQALRSVGLELNELTHKVNGANLTGGDTDGVALRGTKILLAVAETLDDAVYRLGGELRDIEQHATAATLDQVRAQCHIIGGNLRRINDVTGGDLPALRHALRSLGYVEDMLGGVKRP